MQILFVPSSPPPSPPRSSKDSNIHPHKRTSFKAGHISRTLGPNSTASLPTSSSSAPNPHHAVVDLTDSPAPSPCSSNTSLSRSSSLYRSLSKARRSKSPARPYPPPSFIGLPNPLPMSKSTPAFATPTQSVATAPSASTGQPETSHKRAMFILPGDGDSDRDREGEGSSAHDESDDSDRTSFFSAEDFVVSSKAVGDAGNVGGTALDTESEPERSTEEGWESAKLYRENSREGRDAPRDSEQDAAYGLRRWHALMELVHTEVSYVRDLRVLVNVYLALLPSLPLSGPAYLAVQELTGDASALLALHERFARALEDASAQAAGGASPSEDVDQAIQKVANLFVDEASTFDLYQGFCATQPDAVRLLRPAQARVEWAAFEQRCTVGGGDVEAESLASRQDKQEQTESQSDAAASASANTSESPSKHSSASDPVSASRAKSPPSRTTSLMPSSFKSYAASHRDTPPSQTSKAPPSPRRHSYDSFAGVFGASSSGTVRHRPGIARPASDLGRTSTAPPIPQLPNSKLRFYDFLIKPVQRICKYPLMLEGLRSRVRRQDQSPDAAVASAVESMRAVATRVDEARRRRETIAKTKLIMERIEPHAVVTHEFLSSLGDCLLAGSLDVVYHHHVSDPITAPVRVRYLGAFLYPGGYLLLIKIGKGKAYRIRHWFSLAPFEVVDIPEDIALVSSSFRLSYKDHHFELAAACRREKDLWLRAINEARCAPSTWPVEPLSSLQSLHSDQSATSLSDGSAMSPLEHIMKRASPSGNTTESSNPLGILRLSSARFRHSTPTPTVRYIFSPADESSILLRRSSEANRIFVDRGLADILTDLVASVRKQAQARQEQLFPPPGIAEASQTLAVAAKNKLMGRGGVVMARSRSLLIPGTTEEDGPGQSFTVRPKATPTRKRMPLLPALSVLYTEPESIENTNALTHAELQFPRPDSSSDYSHSQLISTTITSRPPTPTSAPLERQDTNPHYHRRARSLVGSVRGMMRLGSTKFIPVQQSSEAWQVNRTPEDSSSDKGDLTEMGSKDSICRRRVSSAPTSPLLSSPNALSIFIDCDPGSRPPSLSPDASNSPSSSEVDPPSPFAPPGSKLFRKKSGSVPPNPGQTLKPRRSFKSFMFYNRLTAVDPA